jgi:16S rRNA A1518/A1519 N6-dimethyltransferase RsmA/KsgA/DIM1 with predicted DNA glycosylase/AP lyase activity
MISISGDQKENLASWFAHVIGCPQCKEELVSFDHTLHCSFCQNDYKIIGNIPALITPELRVALEEEREPVKTFYQKERYDWTTDPRGLEYLYHHFRRWDTWRYISRIIKPGDVVLDIGCGTGMITQKMGKVASKVIAMDLNCWALARVNTRLQIDTIQGDGEALPIQN